jgi:Crassvirales DNA primase
MVIDLNKEKQLISKEAILKFITDLEIYQKYLDSNEEIMVGKPILSPLRRENNPSFALFLSRGSGEILFKDFLLGAGDCIKFVQMKLGLTYFEALSRIATDFDLADDYRCKKMDKIDFTATRTDFLTRENVLSRVTPFKLRKKKRPFALHDIMYWQSFGISVATLEKYNVEAVDYMFINDKIHKADKHAYCFIEAKDYVETYKIYQPFNENYKWINGHNDAVWQGWEQLPAKGDLLIVTKSLKDVMSLYEVAGISAVSLQSENVLPKKHVFEDLKDRFSLHYLLYDNDFDKEVNWGKKFGDKIAQQFGLIDLYIPDKYKCKDFSDLVKKHGREKAKYILEQEMQIPF